MAGSVLAKFAFENEEYASQIKKQFLKKFDKDGSGELDHKEFMTFLAAHVKQQFRAGLVPTRAFTDDGSLELDQIERLIETRCADMLKGPLNI